MTLASCASAQGFVRARSLVGEDAMGRARPGQAEAWWGEGRV
jgi:hypothetical protein